MESLPDPYANQKLTENLPHDPVEWTKKVRILNNKPFSFKKRDHLLPIYRDKANIILITKGRQTELTETIANLMLNNAWEYPHTTSIYASDTMGHTSIFSNRRMRDEIIQQSPIIQQIVPIRNHTATKMTLTNSSICYFITAWNNYRAARSIPADFIWLDEIQNHNLTARAVIMESMSHSKFKRLFGVGTGSPMGSDWQKWHSTGTNSHWNKKKKKWIHSNKSKIHSYTIPQTIVPTVTAEEIEEKRRTMLKSDFTTEVMGGWSEGDEIPITLDMVEKLFVENLSFTLPKDIDRSLGPVGVSMDWGRGKLSWLVAGAYQQINKDIPIVRALNIQPILFPDWKARAQACITFTENYQPDFISVDNGGDSGEIQEMEDYFGPTNVWKTHYLGDRVKKYILNEFYTKGLIKASRTYTLLKTIDLIKKPYYINKDPFPRIELPGENREDLSWLPEHYTSLYAIETENHVGIKSIRYEKNIGKRNDGIMNLNYFLIGLDRFLSENKSASGPVVGDFGGNL